MVRRPSGVRSGLKFLSVVNMAEWTDGPPRPKRPGQDLALKKNGQCSDCLVIIGPMMRFSPRPEIWTKSFGCE